MLSYTTAEKYLYETCIKCMFVVNNKCIKYHIEYIDRDLDRVGIHGNELHMLRRCSDNNDGREKLFREVFK